jgi:hypothetical protein
MTIIKSCILLTNADGHVYATFHDDGRVSLSIHGKQASVTLHLDAQAVDHLVDELLLLRIEELAPRV